VKRDEVIEIVTIRTLSQVKEEAAYVKQIGVKSKAP